MFLDLLRGIWLESSLLQTLLRNKLSWLQTHDRFPLCQDASFDVLVGHMFNLTWNKLYRSFYIQFNPLLALTYQNVLDLNVACRAKRTQTYWHVCKFKCPLKKTQPSCPCSTDLNWIGKGLKQLVYTGIQALVPWWDICLNVTVPIMHWYQNGVSSSRGLYLFF
jgi:hypothetical protein